MPDENPYAPPITTAEPEYAPAGATGGTLDVSAAGWSLVESMARWMRFVAITSYVGAALTALGACAVLTLGPHLTEGTPAAMSLGDAVIAGLLLAVYAVLFLLSAHWLRRAARFFVEGVLSDHPSPLAMGFRNLRLHLILYAVVALLGLLNTVHSLATGG